VTAPAATPEPLPQPTTVGVLGGTGDQGLGLARRLAMGGVEVVLGSRSAERAEAAAAPLAEEGLPVRGADNATAAGADAVIVAVPYDGHAGLLRSLAGELAGKVVIDCVNPLGFDKQGAYLLDVEAGSAALEAQQALPDSTVVAAFHHVSAKQLADPDVTAVDMDVLVLGDVRPATDMVQQLVGRIAGMRGIYAGRLRNAKQVEGLTANLISVNRRYKAHAGVRVTDV